MLFICNQEIPPIKKTMTMDGMMSRPAQPKATVSEHRIGMMVMIGVQAMLNVHALTVNKSVVSISFCALHILTPSISIIEDLFALFNIFRLILRLEW